MAAEAAPASALTAPSPSPFKNNPTLTEIFDAYQAEKESPHAYKKCKHPQSCKTHLLVPRELWGDMRDDFRAGSKPRVKTAVVVWLTSGSAVSTTRKRCALMRAAFKHAISEEIIDRGQDPWADDVVLAVKDPLTRSRAQ